MIHLVTVPNPITCKQQGFIHGCIVKLPGFMLKQMYAAHNPCVHKDNSIKSVDVKVDLLSFVLLCFNLNQANNIFNIIGFVCHCIWRLLQ